MTKNVAMIPIRAKVYGKYLDPEQPNYNQMVQGIVATVASTAMAPGAGVEGSLASEGSNFPFDGLLSKTAVDDGQPQAYLNYLVFDKNMVLIEKKSGYEALTTAAREDGTNRPHEELSTEIIVTEPGYVYIYPEASSGQVLSNDSPMPKDVYFDQFNVEHAHSAIVQSDDYYPFGLTFNSYRRENSVANKYLYNGKELENELGLDLYFYGARHYDPQLGRWTTLDPLADAYVDFSPYAYVLNNPLKFVDPDGKKVLYINGYWRDDMIGKNVIGSSKPGRGYWGRGFVRGASKFFNDGQRGNGMFIDGSTQWGGDESGSERYTRGYEYAKKHYDELKADMRHDETFKIVTHSEGGAFGAGIAQYLLDQGQVVETVVHLSPDESDEFGTPEEPDTYQLNYGGDWVVGTGEVSGVDKSGVVDKFDSFLDKAKFSHGSTKGGGVWREVKALLDAATKGTSSVNVKETKSGVTFTIVRENKKKEEEK